MADSIAQPKPYELRIAGVACLATLAVLTAFLLLGAPPRTFILTLAYGGLIASAIYGLDRIFSFSQVEQLIEFNDPNYFASPSLLLITVLTPPLLYMLSELRYLVPGHYDWAYITIFSIVLLAFVLSVSFPVDIEVGKSDLFSWLSVPLSVGTFVLLLGADGVFGYFSRIVPNIIFDSVEASRWVFGLVIGVAILFQTVAALFRKSGAFIDIARHWSSLRPLAKAASSATGLYRVTVSGAVLFLTIGKYVLMLFETIWVFFSTIFEALFNAARSFLNWRRLSVTGTVCLLILAGLSITVGAPIYVAELDRSLETTRYDTELFLRFFGFVAWVAALGLAQALLCYKRRDELVSSIVLVATMAACGIWVGVFVFRTLSSFGAIKAAGFSLAVPSWFFLFVPALMPLGGLVAWWHVAAIRRQAAAPAPTSPPVPARGNPSRSAAEPWYERYPSREPPG